MIGLFPELLPSEFRKQLEYPAPPPQLTAGELEKGCLALVEYLTQVTQIRSLFHCAKLPYYMKFFAKHNMTQKLSDTRKNEFITLCVYY